MAVSTRGRHKLQLADRQYLWWVQQADPEYNCDSTTTLAVASQDGRFFVRFYLGQPSERRFLIVIGREFCGLPDAGGPWIRIRCPEWQAGVNITPAAVRRLIEWCQDADRPLVRVDCVGRDLAVGSSA